MPSHRQTSALTYALARIDASGRIADHTTPTALGWQPGDTLTATETDNAVITLHRTPVGNTTLSPKHHPTIPTILRRRFAIRTGDQLFLAADPTTGTLHIHTLNHLDHHFTPHPPDGAT